MIYLSNLWDLIGVKSSVITHLPDLLGLIGLLNSPLAMAAPSPREHIEEIRRNKFSIGGEENPLTEDLHHAVRHLSAELYTKDVHFLMELIQVAFWVI